MPVDILSSIKGAQSSEAVDKLFDVIKKASIAKEVDFQSNTVEINDLRADEIIESSAITKQIIKENFPKEKNGYLVVSKVIEG